MLTNLEVFTAGITTAPLPIVDQPASLDAIQIKNIDGLGPVKANVNTAQYGSIDGEFLTGTATPKRNIVITVNLSPNWATQSIESLRQILYSYFMPENTVRLRFSSTHMPAVEISGVVESCEPNLFAKDPEYQISIICTDPYFTAISLTTVNGLTTALGNETEIDLLYQGTAPAGFTIDVTIPSGGSNYVGEFRFVGRAPDIQLGILTNLSLTSAQTLQISTIPGNKYARYLPVPAGQYTNVMQKVSPGSKWWQLRRGLNHIQMVSSTAGLPWVMSYYARYGGL